MPVPVARPVVGSRRGGERHESDEGRQREERELHCDFGAARTRLCLKVVEVGRRIVELVR